MGQLLQFREQPIQLQYPRLTAEAQLALQHGAGVTVLQPTVGLALANTYYQEGLAGALSSMYARKSVADCVEQLRHIVIGDGYGLRIFDAFRSQTTQIAIFEKIAGALQRAHPEWDLQRVQTETRRYVAHPIHSPYPVLPHNSGGALDLTLTMHGRPIDMGTAFDTPIRMSETAYFEGAHDPMQELSPERWMHIRDNRRMLFHVMCYLGFTAHEREWWHFDLGNCRWANVHNVPWYYPSMEHEVLTLCACR